MTKVIDLKLARLEAAEAVRRKKIEALEAKYATDKVKNLDYLQRSMSFSDWALYRKIR